MASTPKISVIIPAYNVEMFIGEALDSLIAQDFSQWEAIVVVDGNKDKTEEIVASYSARDARIKLVTQAFSGVADARNAGLARTQGEWIVWLDSDDLLAPGALSTFLHLQLQFNADIVQGCYKKFNSSGRELFDKLSIHSARKFRLEVRDSIATLENSLYQRRGYHNSMWGNLFRRTLFEGESFTSGILYEDLDIFYRLVVKASTIVHTDQTLYLYRQNPDSLLHRFNRSRLDVLDVTARISNFMEENYPELHRAALDRRFAANFNMYRLMNKIEPESYKTEIHICEKFIRRMAPKVLFDPKSRIKNKAGAIISMLLPSSILRHL